MGSIRYVVTSLDGRADYEYDYINPIIISSNVASINFRYYIIGRLVNEVTVPIVDDGAVGPMGQRGALPYPAGEFDMNTIYTATKNIAPYVYYTPGKSYYVMNREGVSVGINPVTDYAQNGQKAMWIPFENFKAIYVELLMARLGLIGKAVFYDEYMFSQHGTDLAGNPSTNYKGFADGTFTPNILLDFMRGIGHLAGGNLWWDVFGNSFFKGSIFSLMRQIERPSGTIVYLDFSTGFNIDITGLTNDVSDGPITALLPTASDYNGAECTIWYAHACTRVPHEHPHIGIVNNGGFLNLLFEKKYAIKFVPETFKKIKLSAMPNYDESGVASVRWYVDTPEYVTAIE